MPKKIGQTNLGGAEPIEAGEDRFLQALAAALGYRELRSARAVYLGMHGTNIIRPSKVPAPLPVAMAG